MIVVDQFRYDYLTRFKDLFGPAGLKRLMREGAFWTNVNYPFVPTKTAPGHTAIMTGAPPSVSGIAGNEWIERESGRTVTSVGDNNAKLLGGGPGEVANSPHRMLASTVGDELRLATNDRAKVIGISEKARAAILPAGRRANAAYWLSSSSGNVVSSDYYFQQLPDWVLEFNRSRPLDKYFGARWDRLLPEAEYLKRAGADSPPWEIVNDAPGETNAFPHWVTGGATKPGTAYYDALDHSPFVNDVLVSFAERAIEMERLGEDDDTDLLSVSLSGNDHVGHRFGPASQEVMDMALRVDRQIAGLLDFVDSRVGLKKTLVVFSSDHGVSPAVGQSAARGIKPTVVGTSELMNAIRAAINAHFSSRSVSGRVVADPKKPATDYIFKFRDGSAMKDAIANGNVYFDLEALKRDGVSLDEITRVAGEAALKVPGIARYFTRSQLGRCAENIGAGSNNRLSKPKGRQTGISILPCSGLRDSLGTRVLRGFDPKLSGDLIVVQKPFVILGDSVDPATHGSPYSYDTHVPLIIMGAGLRAGGYHQPATPLDIAPTVTSVLKIPTPSKSQGRILREALTSDRSKQTIH
ncbi:MAG: alkaline phosphatase family protein [Acidobacteriota bacterium]